MPSGRACPAASLTFRLAALKSTSIASTQILRQYRLETGSLTVISACSSAEMSRVASDLDLQRAQFDRSFAHA